MTGRLSRVRRQPLLESPGGEVSPWMEVSPKQLREVKRKLRSLAGDDNWRGFTVQAVDMRRLGLDVSGVVEGNEEEMRDELQSLAGDDYWLGFTWQAADLKELGLLTPNPDYGGVSTPPMPPIKEVDEGG